MKTTPSATSFDVHVHSQKRRTPIHSLSVDICRLFISFLPDKMHPFVGYSLNITSPTFWDDFLCTKQTENSRNVYFSNPLERKMKWLLEHKESENLILTLAQSYERNPLFLSIVEQLLQGNENPYGFASQKRNISSFFSIHDFLSQYSHEFRFQTQNVPIKNHLIDLFQENIITFDDLPDLTRSDVRACLSNSHIQNLLAYQIITLDDLKGRSWWKLALGTQIPFHSHFLKTGHTTLSDIESQINTSVLFIFKISVLFLLLFCLHKKKILDYHAH